LAHVASRFLLPLDVSAYGRAVSGMVAAGRPEAGAGAIAIAVAAAGAATGLGTGVSARTVAAGGTVPAAT